MKFCNGGMKFCSCMTLLFMHDVAVHSDVMQSSLLGFGWWAGSAIPGCLDYERTQSCSINIDVPPDMKRARPRSRGHDAQSANGVDVSLDFRLCAKTLCAEIHDVLGAHAMPAAAAGRRLH